MRLTPDKKLHSREHVLAEDLSRMLGEPKRFAAYLGIALRHDESDLRALARYVVEKEGLPLEARGKYFFASLKGLLKKPGVRITPKKKSPSKSKTKKHADKKTGHNNEHRKGTRPTGRSFGRARKSASEKSV